MNQNPLINQSNIKYNPDIISKYQTFKSRRDQGYSIPQGDKPMRVSIVGNDGDIRKRLQTFNKERSEQDSHIQQIFSNQNRYRNKQIFDERQIEINKVIDMMKKSSTIHEIKEESKLAANKEKENNLFEELKKLIISYD